MQVLTGSIKILGEKLLHSSLPQVAFLFAVVLGSTLLASFAITRLSRIAHMYKLFNEYNERTVHTGLIPRLGGISFLPTIAFTVCFFGWCSTLFFGQDLLGLFAYSELLLLFAAMLVVFAIGIEDDIVGLTYKPKFLGQVLASILLISSEYIYIYIVYGDLYGTIPCLGG